MLKVIGLGAGVQSSTLALMWKHGELEADVAIFADTQHEPKAVYDWLERLIEEIHPLPIIKVTAGSLVEGVLEKTFSIPLFVDQGGTKRRAMARRHCTGAYKIAPVERQIKDILGYKKGSRIPKDSGVLYHHMFGISLDEIERMKHSRYHYAENVYPLVDRRMTRHDCKLWLERHGYPEPPKSACTFCPLQSNTRWRELRDSDPASWKEAVDLEAAMQATAKAGGKVNGGMKGMPYLHESLKPLPMVNLDTAEDAGQMGLFAEECEGYCGI